jgi:hypothetical protein
MTTSVGDKDLGPADLGASAQVPRPLTPAQPTPTASELGLPWHLRDSDEGYEINVTPVGWLFRIILADTIGNHPRDNDEPFRELQRQHAAFIVRACNSHDDLLAALEEALEHIGLVRLQRGFSIEPIRERARDAIAKAKAGA